MARARGPTEKKWRDRFRPYRPDTERRRRASFCTRPMILQEGYAGRIQALFHRIGQECPANLTRADFLKAVRTKPPPSYYAEKYGDAKTKELLSKLKDKQLPTKFKDDAMTTSADGDDATPRKKKKKKKSKTKIKFTLMKHISTDTLMKHKAYSD